MDTAIGYNRTVTDGPYEETYLSMLREVQREAPTLPGGVCSMWPAVGAKYGDGLRVLLVGRAANGWIAGTDPLVDRPEDVVHRARSHAEETTLQWVLDHRGDSRIYNTARSQFWMTAGAMLEALDRQLSLESFDWVHRLAWTNLWKVSPSKGGNPTGRLWRAQDGLCRQLLLLELELLAPDLVIAFTGWEGWLEPMMAGMHLESIPGLPELPVVFRRVGRDGAGRVWLITRHPQGAPGGRAVYTEGARLAKPFIRARP